MATRKSRLSALQQAMDKLSAQFPKGSRGPILYQDQDLINLAQDRYRMKVEPRAPRKRARITGKWYEIGTLKKEDVTENQDQRLQYWFDMASNPKNEANYWGPYFAELEKVGGENWDKDDWKKWRIWYFSMHPEQRAVYQERKARKTKQRDRKRSKNMTQQQRDERNARRRQRYAERQAEEWRNRYGNGGTHP